jgi:RNA recognition motif-containing protein
MSRVGVVERVEIRRDQDGRSKGFGFVTFVDSESAQKAILDLGDTRFEDRTVHVDVFKPPRSTTEESLPQLQEVIESDESYSEKHHHHHHHKHHRHHHHHHKSKESSGHHRGTESKSEETRHKRSHHHHHRHHHRHHRRQYSDYSEYSEEK